LISFLGDEERSAKAGVPVYRLAGGAGFLWVATFDQNGRGALQYLAIDDSKIEPSGQVASNSENQAESNSSAVNPPAVTQPGLQRQSRSQTGHAQAQAQAQAKEDQYRQEQEKRQVEEVDRQLKEAQQLLGAQNRRLSTITEVAITIFVLLCGVGVAVFLRVKRQIATPTSYR
jgi:cobalamin biosynthesis Mg chelatase CobN